VITTVEEEKRRRLLREGATKIRRRGGTLYSGLSSETDNILVTDFGSPSGAHSVSFPPSSTAVPCPKTHAWLPPATLSPPPRMLLPLPSKNVEEGAPSMKTMPCRSDAPRLAFLRSAQQTLMMCQLKPNMDEGAPHMKTMPCRSDAPRPALLRSAQQSPTSVR